jgi:hypothetical protein
LGGSTFFMKQCAAVAGAAAWAFIFTYAMLWLIDKVTSVRVEHADEEVGLDDVLHGERADHHAEPVRISVVAVPPPRNPKAKPTWIDVKAKLADFDRAKLLSVVADLYSASNAFASSR